MEESERKAVSEANPSGCEQTSTLNPACEQPNTSRDCEANLQHEDEDDNDDIEKKLDISSDKFDPLLALYSPQVQLPYPNIRCFNNISEYESFMKGGRGRAKPENVEKKLRKAQKGVADPERIERLKRLMVNNPVDPDVDQDEKSGAKRSARKQKARKNVLTRMPLHEGSPLGVLNRCVQERIRVKVHIRSFKGLRGICTGFVVAFDKFWNMAMVDVDETYREPLLGEAFYHEKALTVTRLFEKLHVQEMKELSTAKKHCEKEAPVKTLTPGDMSSETHRADKIKSRTVRDPRQAAERSTGAEKSSAGSDTATDHRPQKHKPKVEYGKVRTRHVNQLFIRGENVLLVNVQRD